MEVKNKTYGYLQCCLCEGSCTVTNTWGESKYTIWLYLLWSARVCTTFAFVTKSSKQCPLRISTASPSQHKFGTSRPPFGFEGIAVVTETDPTVVIFSWESEKIKKIALKNLLVLRKNINLKWWSNWWHRKPLIYSCLHVAACLIMKQILLFFITQSAHGYTTESLRQRSFFRSASIHFQVAKHALLWLHGSGTKLVNFVFLIILHVCFRPLPPWFPGLYPKVWYPGPSTHLSAGFLWFSLSWLDQMLNLLRG